MLALLLAALLQDPKTLRFEPPAKAKPEDIVKAAVALEARCKAYGYGDVAAKVIKVKGAQLVELSCKEGFTPAMVSTVDRDLCRFPVSSCEIGIQFTPTQAERDRFESPDPAKKDWEKTKRPAGARWAAYRWPRTEERSDTTLLVDAPLFTKDDFKSEFEKPISESPNSLKITLTDSGKKKWMAIPEARREGGLLVIYNGGLVFSFGSSGFSEKDGVVSASLYVQRDEVLPVAIPIPFTLRPTK